MEIMMETMKIMEMIMETMKTTETMEMMMMKTWNCQIGLVFPE